MKRFALHIFSLLTLLLATAICCNAQEKANKHQQIRKQPVIDIISGYQPGEVTEIRVLETVPEDEDDTLETDEFNNQDTDESHDFVPKSGDIQSLDNINVYPNPVSDYLQLRLKNSSVFEISLFSVTGQLMLNQKSDGTYLQTIDVSNFAAGMYLLVLQEGEIITTKKIEIIR